MNSLIAIREFNLLTLKYAVFYMHFRIYFSLIQ